MVGFVRNSLIMEFSIEKITKNSGRLGNLIYHETGKKFQTPSLMQVTKGGSIPHLAREAFEYVTKNPEILEINLSSTENMEESLKIYDKGIASFVGYRKYPTFITFRDPTEIAREWPNDKNAVPLFTRRGKLNITPDRYMSIMENFKPTMYQLLADSDQNEESGKKRLLKAVERTEIFFKACLEKHKNSEILKKSLLFAPIIGGYSLESRKKIIDFIKLQTEIGGYIIDGLHNNGETANWIKINLAIDMIKYCIENLPENKPKMMLGSYGPLATLEFIRLGVDIFDSTYAYLATSKNQGLIFAITTDEKCNHETGLVINLSLEKYKDDFSPLLENCTCMTCERHTKAYINHLINTNELLAPILLMIHNTHHYMRFFDEIRNAVAKDSLAELIELISKQNCNKNLSTESLTDDSTIVNKTRNVNSFVNMKVANTSVVGETRNSKTFVDLLYN